MISRDRKMIYLYGSLALINLRSVDVDECGVATLYRGGQFTGRLHESTCIIVWIGQDDGEYILREHFVILIWIYDGVAEDQVQQWVDQSVSVCVYLYCDIITLTSEDHILRTYVHIWSKIAY